MARPEYLRVNIHEPHRVAHVATGLLMANAQQALAAGRYDGAEALIAALAVGRGGSLSFSANGQELLSVKNTVSAGSGDVGFVVNTAGGAPLDVA